MFDYLPINLINCSISIECHNESTAYLEVHSQPGVLHPNKTMEVEFLFYPREAKQYHMVIPFEINGLSKMNVEIFGEGTDMKVRIYVQLFYDKRCCLKERTVMRNKL